MRSFIKSVLTVKVARFMFFFFALMSLVVAYLEVGYANTTSQALAARDLIIVALLALSALFFAWLGFSSKGKELLALDAVSKNERLRKASISKILMASYGIAGGIWLILIVLSLVISGPDLVTKMFEPWVMALLVALSFPIAYKWLK